MAQLSPGASLSHDHIVSQLGAGGMGEVYLRPDPRFVELARASVSRNEFGSG